MDAAAPPLATSVRGLFERSGVAPARVGLAIAGVGIGVLMISEAIFGRLTSAMAPGDPEGIVDGIQVSATHIVISAYLVTAWVYALRTTEATISSLSRAFPEARLPELPLVRGVGERRLLWALGGIGLLAAWSSSIISPGIISYWPSDWTPETAWHRVLSFFIGFWLVRLVGLIVIDSLRLSRMASELRPLDLLDTGKLAPLTRQGLNNALLWIGVLSVFALFVVEDLAYLPVFGLSLAGSLVAAVAALLLPTLGARRAIRQRKQQELAWCRARLVRAREALDKGGASPETRDSIQELVAWEARIERIREWPFEGATLRRFALYLLIPLLSWSGGAVVERAVDALLD